MVDQNDNPNNLIYYPAIQYQTCSEKLNTAKIDINMIDFMLLVMAI